MKFVKKKASIFSKVLKFLLIINLVFLSYLMADDYRDVIYLKDGSIVKGVIVENTINKNIKVETSEGSIINYNYEDIEKFGKEKIKSLKQSSKNFNIDESTKVGEINENFTTFNIGFGMGMLQNHFGIFLDLTTPYFFNNIMAFSLYGGGYLVDSTIYKDINKKDRKEQFFGNFRFSFVSSYNGSNFRAYSKVGPSMAIVRDKTWKNYSRAILGQTLEEKDGHDFLFGMHGLIGVEWFLIDEVVSETVFIELGWEAFFNGYISPNSYALSELIDQDTAEINFVISVGSRVFTP